MRDRIGTKQGRIHDDPPSTTQQRLRNACFEMDQMRQAARWVDLE
jgi:hypothetical protein